MPKRKYREPRVQSRVQVGSNSNYFFAAVVNIYRGDEFQRRKTVFWSYLYGFEPRSLPGYLKREIVQQIGEMVKSETAVYLMNPQCRDPKIEAAIVESAQNGHA